MILPRCSILKKSVPSLLRLSTLSICAGLAEPASREPLMRSNSRTNFIVHPGDNPRVVTTGALDHCSEVGTGEFDFGICFGELFASSSVPVSISGVDDDTSRATH